VLRHNVGVPTSADRDLHLTYPRVVPSARELDDVELLRMSGLGQQHSFGGPESDVRLAIPIGLLDAAQSAGGVEIIDAEGIPLALVSLEDTYPVSDEMIGVIGDVRPLPGASQRPFDDLYLPPSASRTGMPASTLTVLVDAALTAADLEHLRAAERPILLLVMAGVGSPRGLSRVGLVRAALAAASELEDVKVIAVPAARREDSERDARFRKVIAAAYGPGPDVWLPTGLGRFSDAVEAVIGRDRPTGEKRGGVLFFTGLSGSGKSTLAQAVRNHLVESDGRMITLLDGDLVRRNLSKGLTFSREDRETNVERIGWVAAEIARHGGMVICSPIAPFDRTRKLARSMATDVGADFVLVHVATPLEVCESRDRKGLYARARLGEVPEFTGVTSPYEEPLDAELRIDTTQCSPAEACKEILKFIEMRGWFQTRA
jgi:sulfate adenylyltransferase